MQLMWRLVNKRNGRKNTVYQLTSVADMIALRKVTCSVYSQWFRVVSASRNTFTSKNVQVWVQVIFLNEILIKCI